MKRMKKNNPASVAMPGFLFVVVLRAGVCGRVFAGGRCVQVFAGGRCGCPILRHPRP